MLLKNIAIYVTAALATAAPLDARDTHPEVAAQAKQDYLIIFEKGFDTPDRLVRQVANNLKKIGAQINFEYHTVIKGFAVSLPKDLVSDVHAFNNPEYPFVVEEDKEARTLV